MMQQAGRVGALAAPIGVAGLNALPDEQARRLLAACCAATAWVDAILTGRPYQHDADVYARSELAAAELDEAGLDEAMAGHPRIGERPQGEHAASSRREQAGVSGAGDATLRALADGNARYEHRFGHVYLVNASGRSAEELLAVLHQRLGNDPATERAQARLELAGINANRLGRLLG